MTSFGTSAPRRPVRAISCAARRSRTRKAIFWPNVFSPNDDGLNDFWFPLFSCPLENFTLKIFDRWGELVWQTDDPNAAGWDGIFRKRKMQDAVFAYYAEWDFVEVSGGAARRFFKKGNVTLVR